MHILAKKFRINILKMNLLLVPDTPKKIYDNKSTLLIVAVFAAVTMLLPMLVGYLYRKKTYRTPILPSNTNRQTR